tara:strand:- start:5928 stop:6785 length:858 start_codon:yes stop_codon:yes gene_type:complete
MYITDADALTSTLPEPRQAFYIGCNQLFFDMQVVGFVETIDAFVLANNTQTNTYIIDEVTLMYNEYLINLLASHGVVVDDEQSPDSFTYLAILETLWLLPQIEDAQMIIDTLTGSEDNIEALAMLVESVSTQGDVVTWSTVTQAVTHVDEALMDRLVEIANGKIDNLIVNTTATKERAKQRYEIHPVATYPANPLRGMLERGIDYGLPLDTLWLHANSTVDTLIESKAIVPLAALIYGCVLISDVEDHLLQETTQLLVNTEIGDEVLAAAIMRELNQTIYPGRIQ